jgi:hypothetical protein
MNAQYLQCADRKAVLNLWRNAAGLPCADSAVLA